MEFLHSTAVLEEFDVALCEAVTGDDAARPPEQLVAANLFVVRLDVGGRLVPLPPPLRCLPACSPAVARPAALAGRPRTGCHGSRGAWRHRRRLPPHDRRGGPRAGGDDHPGDVARLLTVVEPDATAAAARHWLNRRGRDLVVTDPEQVLEYLLPLVALGSADDATWWFEALTAAHPEAGPTLTAMLEGTRAEHHLCRGEAEEAVARSRIALDAVEGRPPRVGALPGLPVQLARAHLQVGDRAGAGEVLAATQAVGTGHPVADRVRAPGRAGLDRLPRRRAPPVRAALHRRARRRRRSAAARQRAGTGLRRPGQGRPPPRTRRGGRRRCAARPARSGRRPGPPTAAAEPGRRPAGPLRPHRRRRGGRPTGVDPGPPPAAQPVTVGPGRLRARGGPPGTAVPPVGRHRTRRRPRRRARGVPAARPPGPRGRRSRSSAGAARRGVPGHHRARTRDPGRAHCPGAAPP